MGYFYNDTEYDYSTPQTAGGTPIFSVDPSLDWGNTPEGGSSPASSGLYDTDYLSSDDYWSSSGPDTYNEYGDDFATPIGGGGGAGSSSSTKTKTKDPWAYGGPNDPFFTAPLGQYDPSTGMSIGGSQKPSGSTFFTPNLPSTHGTLNGATKTTPWSPVLPTPTIEEVGALTFDKFTAPTRDEAKVKQYETQESAAGLRAMRAAIQKAMSQTYRNPNVKRMTLREALAGYGQGLENIMSSSRKNAESRYNQEYQTAYDESVKNWQSAQSAKQETWKKDYQTKLSQYQTAVQQYLAQFK